MFNQCVTILLVAIGFFGELVSVCSEEISYSIRQSIGNKRWVLKLEKSQKNKFHVNQFPAFLIPSKRPTQTQEIDTKRASNGRLIDIGYHHMKSTKRFLFSFKLNNIENNEDDDEKNNLPSWARSLLRFPFSPAYSPSSEEDYEAENADRSRSILALDKNKNLTSSFLETGPMPSLINVEALLLASGLDDFTEELDPSFFSSPLLNQVKPSPISRQYENTNEKEKAKDQNISSSSSDTPPVIQQVGDWNYLVRNLRKSVDDLVQATPKGPSLEISAAADLILKSATSQIEEFLEYASLNVSPDVVKNLILRAGSSLSLEAIENVVSATETLARERGLDVRSAADQARASAEYTVQLVTTVNGLLSSGYIRDQTKEKNLDGNYALNDKQEPNQLPKPLFHNFPSAKSIPKSDFNNTIKMGVEMASLSGAVYLNTVPETHRLDHSIVANGTTADVFWMVSDSIVENKDFNDVYKDSEDLQRQSLVRTITIRGFDASDEDVDRERLLNQICTAAPVNLGKRTRGVKFHKGLVDVARSIYNEIVQYIDMVGPKHKIILNGHSIGGSLSIIILMLLLEDRGVNYILDKVLRVFAFGSPPIAKIDDDISLEASEDMNNECDILSLLGLPHSMVYGYVQPWDPIGRLFSDIDPLYPLVGDLGEDGVTLYSSGPDRALRPITRAILESWENWPTTRENFSGTGKQDFRSVGVQHILLPEPTRYITDRFVSANIGTSPVESVLKIPSNDLLPALAETFPLDTFTISYVPVALRSFIHHFYPAYGMPFVEYFEKNKKINSKTQKTDHESEVDENNQIQNEKITSQRNENTRKVIVNGIDWAESATKWILGDKM